MKEKIVSVEEMETKAREENVVECGNCGREATIVVGDSIHRCERCAEI